MTPNPTIMQGGGQPSPACSVKLEKNDVSRIRVSRCVYRGHEFIDLRTLVKNYAGDFIPTRKGFTASPEMLPSLISALRRLELEGSGA